MGLDEKLNRLQLRVLQTADQGKLTDGQRAVIEGLPSPRGHRNQPPSPLNRSAASTPLGLAGRESGSEAPLLRGDPFMAPDYSCEEEEEVSIETALEALGHGTLQRRLLGIALLLELGAFAQPALLAALTDPHATCTLPGADGAAQSTASAAAAADSTARDSTARSLVLAALCGAVFGGWALGRATATAAAASALYLEWLPARHRSHTNASSDNRTAAFHRLWAARPAATLLLQGFVRPRAGHQAFEEAASEGAERRPLWSGTRH
ncbi:hypothetical protein EMIHUDRAFT_247845 [Emiliania huxleyi CCMP1516]|uniref:Uncharacterized protein n=2 Tax=Emiliania huxleyi TaxID=2903 RepID=A0A0D3IJU5_EMIH1|nr:hypothetical protein EMIHUDRAFT_247845 [Emiliania huxleyi CCMP1516]EOD11530.1 hypothetical protein EMIHUDRAFT_247845 [Emiliania huxleyi CCMP1516]|eukprot:XP_005763959.1 hypothetical protein EMIHUDRAFT_247845 [Emiliania huxleyi CCMP1516]